MRFRLDRLPPGAVVDLEGDYYADPAGDHPTYPYELVPVEAIVRETEECWALHTSDGVIGYPPDHRIKVRRIDREAREVAERLPEGGWTF